jgi:hypothetical protein
VLHAVSAATETRTGMSRIRKPYVVRRKKLR